MLIFAAIFVVTPTSAPAQGVAPTRPAPATSAPNLRAPAPAHAPARAPAAKLNPPAPADYVDLTAYAKKLGFTATYSKTGDLARLTLQKPGMKLEFTGERLDFHANGMRVFAGSALHADKNTLWMSRIDIDNLLTPIVAPASKRPVPNLRVIAIDPGHGGDDNGASNPRLKINEKTFTLDIAKRLKTLLEQNGYKIVMTRTTDKHIELGDRPAIAAQARADFFISIHLNALEAGGDAQHISGAEVFRCTPRYQIPLRRNAPITADNLENPSDASNYWSTLAAFQVHRALLAGLKVPDRGLKHDKLAVLRLATMPAILVEPGFLTNDAEAKKIMTPAYRQKIAEAIAAGIQSYADVLATLRKN